MTEDFETEALHYLLDDMDAPRRAAFEEQLARDPGARATLKTCADALGRFAAETAPPEPMTAIDQRAALATILGELHASAPASGASAHGKVISWGSYFWPIAAAVLLGLNLLQFERPLGPLHQPVAVHESRSPESETIPAAETADTPVAEIAKAAEPTHPLNESARAAADKAREIDTSRAIAAENTRQLEKLRNDYAALQRNNAALRAEYDEALRHLAGRVLLDKGPGRLAAMELVDARSFQRGERKGLMEVARGILTEPGVVVAEVTPTVTEPTERPPVAGFGPSTAEDKPATPAAAKSPYAWSVFDDKEHQGYLNLYDLPVVAADQSLQLWVKPVDSAEYQRVGEVPVEFYGGSGSVRYRLPETTSVPAEILITQEPRNAAGEKPSGPTVLRGP